MRFSFTLPPPLSCHVSARPARLSSGLFSRLRLQTLRVYASRPRSSKTVATSPLLVARRLRGHNAADDTDAPHCWRPTRLRQDSSNSDQGFGSRGSQLPPTERLYLL